MMKLHLDVQMPHAGDNQAGYLNRAETRRHHVDDSVKRVPIAFVEPHVREVWAQRGWVGWVQSESLQNVAGYGWDSLRPRLHDEGVFDGEFCEGYAAVVLEALGHVVGGERDAGEDEFVEFASRSGHEVDEVVSFF